MQAAITDTSVPALVKAQAIDIDPAAEVILFGSRARGDFRADSDWDFLILISKPLNEKLEQLIRNKLYEMELQIGEVISAVIEEKKRWQDFEVTAFYKNISQEGISIH